MKFISLAKKHARLMNVLKREIKRQHDTIDLIASENIVSSAVLEALATPFANKYAEGYPGKRYYPGNRYVDEIELYAGSLARKLFGLGKEWHVNVQPYSGSPANAEIYMALMNPGEVLMGMALSSGGHLTHGHSISFSGKLYRTIQYGVSPKTGRIDYDELLHLAKKHNPAVIVSGFSAYPRTIDFKKIGMIAKKVGAYHVADISHIAGLVAARLHLSPFPYADAVMTTTHKTLRGPRGAIIFCRQMFAEKIDKAVFPGLQGGPHNNVTFAKAVAFEEALLPEFKRYQKQIINNAKALAGELQKQGLSLVSGGTDTHLVLVDLRSLGIDGRLAEQKLEEVGIIVNRNSIPGDTKPLRPSGIRLGVPSVTTRGMKEREMLTIAHSIASVLTGTLVSDTTKVVRGLCKQFPLK